MTNSRTMACGTSAARRFYAAQLGRWWFLAICCQVALPPAAGQAADEFSRWEEDIARFEMLDAQTPPPAGGNLFVGSSSIRLWDLASAYPDRPVINRGFGGSQIIDSVHFVEQLVLRHSPRVVVLYAGDNDIAAGKTASRVHDDFRDFCQQVHDALPATKIVFVAIKPSLARWHLREAMQDANHRIEATCDEDQRLQFVDIWQPMLGADGRPRKELFIDDGLHLNDQGYRLWTALVRPQLVD